MTATNKTIIQPVPADILANVLLELFTESLDAFEPRIEFGGFTPVQIAEALKARGLNIISIQNDESPFDEAPQFILCSEPNSAETVRVLNELADELDSPPFAGAGKVGEL